MRSKMGQGSRMAMRGGLSEALNFAILGSPHLAIAAMALSMSVFVPQYYAAHTAISLAGVGLAFTIVRLADLLFDPLLGIAVDRTDTRIGRFRPWVILGAPAVMLGAWLTYFPPADATLLYLVIGLSFFYLGHSLISVTTFAWAALVATDESSRSRVYGWIEMASMTGMLLVLGVLPLLESYFGPVGGSPVHAMGVLVLILIPLTVAAVTIFVPEPDDVAVNEPDAFLTTLKGYGGLLFHAKIRKVMGNTLFYALSSGVSGSLFLFFAASKGLATAASLLLLVYFAAAFVSARSWAPLSRRYGRLPVMVALCVASVVTHLFIFLLPQGGLYWALPGQIVLGTTYSGMLVLQRASLGDAAEEIRHHADDVTGRLYAFYAIVTKIGVAIAVGLTFAMLEWIGFNPKAQDMNSETAVQGMQILFIMGPTILIAVAGLSVLGDKPRLAAGSQP